MASLLPNEVDGLVDLPERAVRLRLARDTASMSTAEVAAAAGLTRSYVAHCLAGRTRMSERQVRRIIAAIAELTAARS